MPSVIKKIWISSDKLFLISALITTFSFFLITSFFLYFNNRIPDKVPLFYSLTWGDKQLATKQQFFLLPVMLLLIFLINSLIAFQLHPTQHILKKILMFSLMLIDLIVVITAFKILWIFI